MLQHTHTMFQKRKNFMRWKHTPTMGWKNKIEPGQNQTVEKQKLGMLPEKDRKTKKCDIKNGKLFDLLPPDVIQIIH